uniref:Uncharacterized protein n=1 Tax=Ixodes ricinus TaxID=34613 RepID=A0A6B0UA98_IXORI
MSFLLTLPMALRGICSTTRNRTGIMAASMWCLPQSRSSCRLRSRAGSRRATAHATLSPHVTSGKPTTAQSLMLGWASRWRSTSRALIL